VSEVAQTDVLIAPFVQANRLMFRAPFGDFDPQTAAVLEPSPMGKYVGPVNWDVGDHMGPEQAADWDCWKPGADGVVLTPQQCGDLYVKEIETVGRGIVLMHDPYFVDDDPTKGGTVDMIKYIVPILKTKGYTFVRLDYVPDIAAALPPLPKDAGAASDGADDDASSSSGSPDSSGPVKPEVGGADAGARIPDPCSR
jgi:peptidoglycan-N-acetylglucosamine deacetylase